MMLLSILVATANMEHMNNSAKTFTPNDALHSFHPLTPQTKTDQKP
jgi:hypothetical protein